MPKLLIRAILFILTLLLYVFGIHELRKELTDFYMNQIQEENYTSESIIFKKASSNVSIIIFNTANSISNGWRFRIPFGSFWLYSTLALIIIGASFKDYINLLIIQVCGWLMSTVLISFWQFEYEIIFITIDFICRYLVPLFSLGYVAIVFGNRKSKLVIDAKSS